MNQQELENLKELYLNGYSTREIGELFGKDVVTIWKATKKLGINRSVKESQKLYWSNKDKSYDIRQKSRERCILRNMNNPLFTYKGRKHSKETKEKIGKSSIERCAYKNLIGHSGRHGGGTFLGKHHTQETKMMIAKSVKTTLSLLPPEERKRRAMMVSEYMKQLSESEKIRRYKKMLCAASASPNKKETILDNILQKYFSGEWKYVGKGDFLIGRKIPDFVNINGKKQVIELYGTYWHRGDNPQDRIELFGNYGFSTLIVWEKELDNIPLLVKKIKSF